MNTINYIILLFSLFSLPHPIHVSVSTMQYDAHQNKMKVMIKLFVDDFENIVSKTYNVQLNIGKSNENKKCNFYFDKYINQKFRIKLNDKQASYVALQFKSKKMNEEAIWLHYEIEGLQNVKKIYLYNALMNDLFDDQTNLVIVKTNNNENGYTLNKHNEEIEIEL